jgi:hypothetical protein
MANSRIAAALLAAVVLCRPAPAAEGAPVLPQAGHEASRGKPAAAPPGCGTHYASGSYACSGTCGIEGVTLAVTPGSVTMRAEPFGANSSVVVACSGKSGQPQSVDLVILGQPGHTCGMNAASAGGFGLACRSNNSGGTCASSCARRP